MSLTRSKVVLAFRQLFLEWEWTIDARMILPIVCDPDRTRKQTQSTE